MFLTCVSDFDYDFVCDSWLRKIQLCQKDMQNRGAMLLQAGHSKSKEGESLKDTLEHMERTDPAQFLQLLKEFCKEWLGCGLERFNITQYKLIK